MALPTSTSAAAANGWVRLFHMWQGRVEDAASVYGYIGTP
jgi:hypothetical protein